MSEHGDVRDRERELTDIQIRYESDDAECIVLYGRRRLGKSELARQSITDRDDAVYYQAIESTAPNQLDQFVDAATAQFPDLATARRDWEGLLAAPGDRDAIVVIDEFPFLIEEDDSLPSRIQRVWKRSYRTRRRRSCSSARRSVSWKTKSSPAEVPCTADERPRSIWSR